MPTQSELGEATAEASSNVGVLCALVVLAGFVLFLVMLTFFPALAAVRLASFGGLSSIYFAAAVVFLIAVAAVLIFASSRRNDR